MTEWIKEQDVTICFLQGTHFSFKDTSRLKVKYILHANGNQKKAGAAILKSDKIDIKPKTTRDLER